MTDFLANASERIREYRSAAYTLDIQLPNGQPIPASEIEIHLTRNAFKFGCNAFGLYTIPDPGLQRAYEERFAALLNYATLPFYWGGYEPVKDAPQPERLAKMAAWCQANNIPVKGHPLAWHEVFPKWAQALPDEEALRRQEARLKGLPAEFKDLVPIWDVVNEATVAQRFDNAWGRWIAREGAAAVVEKALRWARAANPGATLLYNDFNIAPEFEALVAELLQREAPMDAIGIQSHMHQVVWPLERAWSVCETYARFGLPLHFTELTVLSGRLKPLEETDWHARHTDWKTTPEGEQTQAEYGAALYTLLYSHPAVQAITWWDFSDYRCWQDAPAGLVREDMSPKPLYERLHALIQTEWATHIRGSSTPQGAIQARCTFGDHTLQAALPSGEVLQGKFFVDARSPSAVTVTVA